MQRGTGGAVGVAVRLRDGRTDVYGRSGDNEWTARRDPATGALVVARLRAGRFEEVRRLYRPDEWSRAEIS